MYWSFSFSGCTNHPAPGEKFCKEHVQHTSPVITPDKISRESLTALNDQHSSREKFLMTGLERDNIFVVEGVWFKTLTSFHFWAPNLVMQPIVQKALKILLLVVAGDHNVKVSKADFLFKIKTNNRAFFWKRPSCHHFISYILQVF